MHYKIFEFKIPVFFGCLISLLLGALIANRYFDLQPAGPDVFADDHQALAGEPEEESPSETVFHNFLVRSAHERADPILEIYRDPESRGRVTEFFTGIISSEEIAQAILSNADEFDISPALALALSWEESRLNPRAVNTKNRDGSIDRGLFQLNNRSFPRLELQAFFNPVTNSWYGMSHLRYCLDTGGSEIAALAMYNAGTGRVRNSGTPKTTLDYVSRILDNRREIESRFLELEEQFQLQPPPLEEYSEIADVKPERPRLVPLLPLGIR